MRAIRILFSSFFLLCVCFSNSATADDERQAEQEPVPYLESFILILTHVGLEMIII